MNQQQDKSICEDSKRNKKRKKTDKKENVLRDKFLYNVIKQVISRYLAHTSLWDDSPFFNLVKTISETYSWLSVNGNN